MKTRPIVAMMAIVIAVGISSGLPDAQAGHRRGVATRGETHRVKGPSVDPGKLKLSLRIAEARRDAQKSRLYKSLTRRKRAGSVSGP